MTNINPELIEHANRARMENLRGKPLADHEYRALRSQVEVDALTAALSAAAPLIAAQALEDARDAGATELLKLLMAEDDAQYIGGSSHGMGPIEACETAEGWLDARAAKLRGGAYPDPLDPSMAECSRCGQAYPSTPEALLAHHGECTGETPKNPMGDPLNEGDHQARIDHAHTLRSVIRAFEASTPYTDPSTSPQTTRKDH